MVYADTPTLLAFWRYLPPYHYRILVRRLCHRIRDVLKTTTTTTNNNNNNKIKKSTNKETRKHWNILLVWSCVSLILFWIEEKHVFRSVTVISTRLHSISHVIVRMENPFYPLSQWRERLGKCSTNKSHIHRKKWYNPNKTRTQKIMCMFHRT